MGIAHTLFRRFLWADNILWKEDIRNRRVTVTLAGKDLITNTKAVAAYLTGSEDWIPDLRGWKNGVWGNDWLDVLWFQELDHGQVFDTNRTRGRLVEIVRKFCIQEK